MGLKEFLLPREARFFDLLENQAAHMLKGADMLVEGLERWDQPRELRKRLKDVEHEGDMISHDLHEQLNQTFITPFDREDIARLGGKLDDVLDFTYATVNHMVMYDIQQVPPPLLQAARLLKEQTQHIAWGVGALRNLRDRETIKKHLVEVNRLENETDEVVNRALADLFRNPESALDVLYVIKMRDVYNYIEIATDKGEDCADVIGDIVVKYS